MDHKAGHQERGQFSIDTLNQNSGERSGSLGPLFIMPLIDDK